MAIIFSSQPKKHEVTDTDTKIAIYSRKSKFTGKGESIENQIEMCRQYARLHYGQSAADDALVYEDEGFSGGTLNRPQFKKMMADAGKKAFSIIVVYRLDRISRNIGDFANLIDRLNEMGIDFVSIREQFDTSSPMGRAMMYISSVFSQLERETIAERIRDNMHELSKTGRWLGGTTPTGYASESVSKITVDGKTKKACKLRIIPEEIEVVKTIYRIFLETNSLTKTDTFLLNNGYLTKNGKQYTRFAIRAILTNPVYMIADEDAYTYFSSHGVNVFAEKSGFDGTHGIMAYNRTGQQPSKTTVIRPVEEWIVAIGEHEGVIDGRTWTRVQAMLERNKSKRYRKARSQTALLSGLLVCGSCGDFMRPKMTSRVNGDGKFVYTYKCTMKERSHGHRCNMRDCNGNVLDNAIMEEVKRLNEDGSEFFGQLKKGNRALAGDKMDLTPEIEKLNKNSERNDNEIKASVSALVKAAGTPAEEYLLAKIDELHRDNEKIKDRIAYLRGIITADPAPGADHDLLAQTLCTFGGAASDLTVEQKRAAVRTLVKQIVWDGADVHVVLFGSDYRFDFPKEPKSIDDPSGLSPGDDANLQNPADGG